MAKITFLIGNGFDLQLGLKTSYRDFYQSLNDDSKNSLISNIKKDYELWSDMEVGLGNCLETCSSESVDGFIDDLIEVEDKLSLFLIKQNQRFQIVDENKVADSLRHKFLSIEKTLPPKYADRYSRIIKNTGESIQYSFICFNYTDTIDQILKTIADKPAISSHVHANTGVRFEDKATMPLHVHGTLEKEMIVGINDASQINNPELKDNDTLQTELIKERKNDYLGNYNTNEGMNLISNSRIIYVYGFSMGATDRIWTDALFDWLNGSPDRLLIIDLFEKDFNNNSASRIIKWRTDTLNRIAINNSIDKQLFNKVKDKICLIANSKIFSIEGYEISS